MLSLRNISKKFGDYQAVKPLSLEVEKGKTTVLIGQSGCGKSTLLRLMTGLFSSDTGSVFLGEEEISDKNILRLRQRMGYVIQDGGLFPHLTARDNVFLMARYLGKNEKELEVRLQELAKLTNLRPEALTQFPSQLSGGQKQRVSLIRALMLDPDILILDEPMGALDPMIRSVLQNDLREIFRSLKKTVVMVTHDLAEAAYFGDTILLMKEGEVIQSGPYRELFQNPKSEFGEYKFEF